jgi:TolA-binding protein
MRVCRFLLCTAVAALLAGLFSCATPPPELYGPEGRPLSITDYEKLAQAEYDEDRYENAIQVYSAIIEHYPENQKAVAWANYEIGYSYFMMEEYEQAELYFRTVINEFEEPAAEKLSQKMLETIREQKKK